jgi:hypothetical protein
MDKQQDWRNIVASSLGWEQAHASLESAVEDFPANLRGQRPDGYPHSAWELLEHMRITQHDLLEFCQNPDYVEELEWPQDYWPSSPTPSSAGAWTKSIGAYKRDRDALAKFATETDLDLTSRIPRWITLPITWAKSLRFDASSGRGRQNDASPMVASGQPMSMLTLAFLVGIPPLLLWFVWLFGMSRTNNAGRSATEADIRAKELHATDSRTEIIESSTSRRRAREES